MAAYNPMELMICCAARLLEDGRTVTVGTGAPCAAAMLAQQTHAPNLVIFFEAGGAAPILPTMPVSVGDSRTFYRALLASSMAEIMETCQRGMMDYAFLGGAQIDAFGNLNSTHIGGTPKKPKVRLPGSGGANDLASFCWKVITMTNHDKRRFVEKVDFLTTPGYLTGPGSREAAALPRDTGPFRVVTDLAVMGYHPSTKRMQILSLHPGVTLQTVQERTGFAIDAVPDVAVTLEPSERELKLLRTKVDPRRYIIGRAA